MEQREVGAEQQRRERRPWRTPTLRALAVEATSFGPGGFVYDGDYFQTS